MSDRVDAPNEFELKMLRSETNDFEGFGMNEFNGSGIMDSILVLEVIPEKISSLYPESE